MPDSANTGGRKPRVSDSDLLDVFRSTTDPVLSTGEVADAVPIKRRGVLNRLRSLEDAGELESKQIGGRNTVWWERRETGESDARADAGRDATETPPDTGDDAHDADGPGEEDPLAAAGDRIDTLDLAGTGTDYERRRDAVLKMYEHLRERPGERVSKGDFADLLDGTDVGYGGGFASLWANWVKSSGDRPNALDTLPGVELQGNDYVFRPEGER
jgi:hypothetical protein